MAVEDILKRIAADAQEEADEILERARSEAGSIEEQSRERIEREREKLMTAAGRRADEERNRVITLARLEARREILLEKQRLIDLVFERTRERISNMERAEYQRLIAEFLMSAGGRGEYDVLVDPDEDRIDQQFLERVMKDQEGLRLRLADERRPIGGGFVLRSGRTESNYALDTILREVRENLETDVAAALFGEGD